MKKLLLLTAYGVGAFLFIKFFSSPLSYILAILLFAGFIALIFSEWQTEQKSDFQNLMWLATSFFWLTDIFGFLSASLDFTLGIFLIFFIGFVIFLASLETPNKRLAVVYSFAGALVLAEFFWAITFLPFAFLTLAGLTFVFFYLIWIVFYYSLRGELKREIIFKNLLFGAALLAVLLLTTRWQP